MNSYLNLLLFDFYVIVRLWGERTDALVVVGELYRWCRVTAALR